MSVCTIYTANKNKTFYQTWSPVLDVRRWWHSSRKRHLYLYCVTPCFSYIFAQLFLIFYSLKYCFVQYSQIHRNEFVYIIYKISKKHYVCWYTNNKDFFKTFSFFNSPYFLLSLWIKNYFSVIYIWFIFFPPHLLVFSVRGFFSCNSIFLFNRTTMGRHVVAGYVCVWFFYRLNFL